MATRWGICGAGKICHDFTSALGTLPKNEHEIIAVASRDLSRSNDFAKLHDISNSYDKYEDLASDKNVEVVYIGTLNPSHFEHAKMMLNAGKHVLCEKPLTMNLKQTKELIQIAKNKNLFLMEAVWSRCFPLYETLKKSIDEKLVGDVKQIYVEFGFQMPEVDRLNSKKLGGGTILDLGIYTVQFACFIFGNEKPLSIKASGHLNDEGVDLSMSAVLTYKNNRTVVMSTQALVDLSNEAKIYGTKGVIKVPNFWCPTSVELPTGRIDSTLPVTDKTLNFTNSTGLSYEAAETRACIKNGRIESRKVSHEDSLLFAEILDELRRQLGVVYEVD